MIDVKTAVKSAMVFFQEMYPENNFENILLEAVELSSDGYFWNVTIGFSRYLPELSSPMAEITAGKTGYRRSYKVFTVDTESGNVQSMKMISHYIVNGV